MTVAQTPSNPKSASLDQPHWELPASLDRLVATEMGIADACRTKRVNSSICEVLIIMAKYMAFLKLRL